MKGLLLAVYVLVAAGTGWTWAIVGGPYDTYDNCEQARADRLDGDYLVCAKLR